MREGKFEDLYYRLIAASAGAAAAKAQQRHPGAGGCWRRRGPAQRPRRRRAERWALALLSGPGLARQHPRVAQRVLEQAAMRSDSRTLKPRCWNRCCANRASSRSPRALAGRGHGAGATVSADGALRPLAEQGRTGAARDRGGRWPPPAATRWRPPNCWGISRAKLYERLELIA